MITTVPLFKSHPALRKVTITEKEQIPYTAVQQNTQYDLVIVGDDATLYLILHSNLTQEEKLHLLPITNHKHFQHLWSKIGLSLALENTSLSIPAFEIVSHPQELHEKAQKLGYPFFIKIDSSGGGDGVFLCENKNILKQYELTNLIYPLLLQEKIEGTLLDISGFYQEENLICFHYAKMDHLIHNAFGPSCVRTYTHPSKIDPIIYQELIILGKALGIHGFANVSCIHSSKDQKRYYIEADLRPNAWANQTHHIGDNHAILIKRYFQNQIITLPPPINPNRPTTLTLPQVFRLTAWQILSNQYNALKYIPWHNPFLLRHFFYTKIYLAALHRFEKTMIRFIKPYFPSAYWNKMKIVYHYLKEKIT